jgi:hypothetical protein
VSWEPIDRLPVLEFLLPGDNPADIFFKTFHKVHNYTFLKPQAYVAINLYASRLRKNALLNFSAVKS